MMHTSHTIKSWAPLVARILLSSLFLWSGFGKIVGFSGTVGYIASVGLPMPEVLAVLAAVFEIAGGLMILFGAMARIGAWLLIVYTVLAAVLFHMDFADQTQMVNFMKNMAITGGLLMVAVYGSGRFSVHRGSADCSCVGCKMENKMGRCDVCCDCGQSTMRNTSTDNVMQNNG